MATIAVLGATGTVGSHLCTLLAGAGHRVRAVHAHPGNAPHAEGVESMQADLTDPDAARRALENATAAYLAPPEGGPQPDITERRVTRNVARAATEAGIEHLIVHTALHCDRQGIGVPLLGSKREVEEAVREAGVPWTILRPGLFLDTILDVGPHSRRQNVLLPFQTAHRFGAVSARDVARAAAALFVAGPQRTEFDLHVPGGVSGEELATRLGEILQRDMEAEVHPEGIAGFAAKLDMNPAQRELYEGLLAYVRDSDFTGQPEAIRRVVPDFNYTPLRGFVHDDLLPRWREFEVSAP